MLSEINAYILRFITEGDTPNRQERGLIFGVALSVLFGLFSAWQFYKDSIFKRNYDIH